MSGPLPERVLITMFMVITTEHLASIITFRQCLGPSGKPLINTRHDLEGQNLTGTYKQIGNPADYLSMYGGLTYEEYLSGFMGRLNYKFRDKYIVGLSLRRDGSSKFLPATRWETFSAWSAVGYSLMSHFSV